MIYERKNNYAVISIWKNLFTDWAGIWKIRKGEEGTYAMLLLPMEGNALKIHREFPESNSRRLREVIALVLFDIKENCSGENVTQVALEMRKMKGLKRHYLWHLILTQIVR